MRKLILIIICAIFFNSPELRSQQYFQNNYSFEFYGNLYSRTNNIVEIPDGTGFIAFDGFNNLFRIDLAGNVIWSIVPGLEGSDGWRNTDCLIIDDNENIVLIGSVYNGISTVAAFEVIDLNGNFITSKTLALLPGFNGHTGVACIEKIPGGGFVIGGRTSATSNPYNPSFPESGCMLWAVNSLYNTSWSKKIGNYIHYHIGNWVTDIDITNDEIVIIALQGGGRPNEGARRIMSFDHNGTLNYEFNASSSNPNQLLNFKGDLIKSTPYNGGDYPPSNPPKDDLFIAGRSYLELSSGGSLYGSAIIRMNSDGTTDWGRFYQNKLMHEMFINSDNQLVITYEAADESAMNEGVAILDVTSGIEINSINVTIQGGGMYADICEDVDNNILITGVNGGGNDWGIVKMDNQLFFGCENENQLLSTTFDFSLEESSRTEIYPFTTNSFSPSIQSSEIESTQICCGFDFDPFPDEIDICCSALDLDAGPGWASYEWSFGLTPTSQFNRLDPIFPNTHYILELKVTNQYGCIGKDVVVINNYSPVDSDCEHNTNQDGCNLTYNDGNVLKAPRKKGGKSKAVDQDIRLLQTVIYPNPSTGIFNLRSNQEILKIEVINIKGEIVLFESLLNSESIQFNLSDQPIGLYFLKVFNTDGSVESHKISRY